MLPLHIESFLLKEDFDQDSLFQSFDLNLLPMNSFYILFSHLYGVTLLKTCSNNFDANAESFYVLDSTKETQFLLI